VPFRYVSEHESSGCFNDEENTLDARNKEILAKKCSAGGVFEANEDCLMGCCAHG
jgi:hypothetical protein